MNYGFLETKCKDCKEKDICSMAKIPNTSGCARPITVGNQGKYKRKIKRKD